MLLWAWSYYYGYYFYAYTAGLSDAHSPPQVNVWAFRAYYFLLVTHICEAALVWIWLIPVKFTFMCRLSWCWYAFMCGWPVTGRAKILCQITLAKQEQRKLAGKVKKERERESEKEKEKGRDGDRDRDREREKEKIK